MRQIDLPQNQNLIQYIRMSDDKLLDRLMELLEDLT